MYYSPHLIDDLRRSNALEQLLTPTITHHHGTKARYTCPVCGSNDAVVFTSRQGVRLLKCFACSFIGDVVELYARLHPGPDGVPNRSSAVQGVLGVFVGRLDTLNCQTAGPAPRPKRDFSQYIAKCVAELKPGSDGWSYLTRRGFSDDDIRILKSEYQIGFDSGSTGHGSLTHAVPCIIIPTGHGSYKGRTLKGDIRYIQPKGTTVELFGADYLDSKDKDFVFILEGEFDALSILIAARYSRYRGRIGAVATSGTGNTQPLINRLTDKPTTATLFVLFDGDTAGEYAAKTLTDAMPDDAKVHNIGHRWTLARYRHPDNTPVKDANELLTVHGPRVLAGLLDGIISHPITFTTV